MQKIIMMLFVVVSFQSLQAQSARSPCEHHLSLPAEGLGYQWAYKFFLVPSWEIRRKMHAFAVGPTILISSASDASDRKYPKLTGLRGAVRHYPFQATGKLDFFFQANLYLQRIVDRWEANSWNQDLTRYVTFGYVNTEWIINPHLGYGLEFKVWKGLFIEQSIGVGYFFSWIDGDETANPDGTEVEEYFDYRPYGNRGLSLGVSLVLGYRIK